MVPPFAGECRHACVMEMQITIILTQIIQILQLYESFSSVMENRPANLQIPSKDGKTKRFDPATAQIVKQMNVFLKESAPSLHAGKSQLVNDKGFRKAVQKGEAQVGIFYPRKPQKAKSMHRRVSTPKPRDEDIPFDEPDESVVSEPAASGLEIQRAYADDLSVDNSSIVSVRQRLRQQE